MSLSLVPHFLLKLLMCFSTVTLPWMPFLITHSKVNSILYSKHFMLSYYVSYLITVFCSCCLGVYVLLFVWGVLGGSMFLLLGNDLFDICPLWPVPHLDAGKRHLCTGLNILDSFVLVFPCVFFFPKVRESVRSRGSAYNSLYFCPLATLWAPNTLRFSSQRNTRALLLREDT